MKENAKEINQLQVISSDANHVIKKLIEVSDKNIMLSNSIAEQSNKVKKDTQEVMESTKEIETISNENHQQTNEIKGIAVVLNNWGVELQEKLNEFKI